MWAFGSAPKCLRNPDRSAGRDEEIAFLAGTRPNRFGIRINQPSKHFGEDCLGRSLFARYSQQWIGAACRNVASSHATTKTKSARFATLRKGA